MLEIKSSSNPFTSNPLALGNKGSKSSNDNFSKTENLCLKMQNDNSIIIEIIKSIKDTKVELPKSEEIINFLSELKPIEKRKLFSITFPGNVSEHLNQHIFCLYKLGQDLSFDENEINLIFVKNPKNPLTSSEESNNFNEKENENRLADYIEFADNNINNCNEEGDTKEDTGVNKEEENGDKKEEIFDEKDIINIFLSAIIFSSIKEKNDTLTFDIESLMKMGNLNKILKYFSNDCHFKENIFPFMFENNWYIPLPNWAYSISNLNVFHILCIILDILILIFFQYYSQKKKIQILDFIQIDNIYEQNIHKINELKQHPNIINNIFSKENLDIVVNNIIHTYFENNTNLREEDINNLSNTFRKRLIKLKDIVNKNNDDTIQTKLEKIFDKISFYNFNDYLKLYDFIYSAFRKFLLKYSPDEELKKFFLKNNLNIEKLGKNIQDLMENLNNKNKKLDKYKRKYKRKTQKLLEDLLKDFNLFFVYFGSNETGLQLLSSDIDIAIYYKEINYSITKEEIIYKLVGLLKEKLGNNYILEKENSIYFLKRNNYNLKKIEYILHPLNNIPLIKLEYDISQESNLVKSNIYKYIKKEYLIIKIDIAFTKDLKFIERTNKMTEFIKNDLTKNPLIKPIVLVMKLLLKKYKLNSAYTGGLSPISVFFLTKNIIKTYDKEISGTDSEKIGKILYLFLMKFSNYDFTYGIDENGLDYPINKSENSKKKRFLIKNPIENNDNEQVNIASGSFNTNLIKQLFTKLLN